MVFLRKHLLYVSVCIVLVLLGTIAAISGKLDYPLIMTERQWQLFRHCAVGMPFFEDMEAGFLFEAEEDMCFLPHRIYPDDGTLLVLDSGWYFVINEYLGALNDHTHLNAIVLHAGAQEEIDRAIDSLRKGGFVSNAKEQNSAGNDGMILHEFIGASGLEEGRSFHWVFVKHPHRDTGIIMFISHPEDEATLHFILGKLHAIDEG